jgi:hypothetical protein
MMSTKAALIRTQALSAAFIVPLSADPAPVRTTNSTANNSNEQIARMLPPIDKIKTELISVFRKRYAQFISYMKIS